MDEPNLGENEAQPCFDVDAMLGKLAKWLRILGFDAAYPCVAPSKGRTFVSARKQAPFPIDVIITSARLADQIEEVFEQMDIRPDSALLFTRCLLCNLPVREIPKEKASSKVPPVVFQNTETFHQCPGCGRIYWEGSHVERTRRRVDQLMASVD
ncbi:MAG: Mut7-C RNAse domain-containing protein [Thermodesulfobacteriota bacterium]